MNKPFIVAEMSANHLNSVNRALAIVDAAAEAGADAIKLQTWSEEAMCLDRSHPTPAWGPWGAPYLADLYTAARLPWAWHAPIFSRARALGIECFSAPFDRESVDFLETLECPRYKIASFELVDLPLISYVAKTGKPMVMSVGMATEAEVLQAVAVARANGCVDLILLKCTSAYPAKATDANLATMASLAAITGGQAGLSDHTEGIGVAVVGAVLGATMIEKHLTLSRAEGGLDASFSMEPHEFKQMVQECRRAVAAVGEVRYGCGPNESTELRRSLYIAQDTPAGEYLTRDNMRTARPALGVSPLHYETLLGRRLLREVKRGEPVAWDMVA